MLRSSGQGSLFERLEPDAAPQRMRTRQQLAAGRIQAIRQHLQWLLNSRKGSSQSSPELGLRDFNDAMTGTADLLLQVRQDIEAVVAAFEPRVSVLGVRTYETADESLDLHFRLDCLVPLVNGEEQVEIDLVIDRRGQLAHIV